jgi:AcrR family transcriptional regulator
VKSTSLRARKKERTRVAIADAAAALFAEHGFEHVTVQDVADAAEVSRQTVFNHFPVKEDLVFDRAGEVDAMLVAAVRERAPGEPLVASFARRIDAFWARIGQLPADRPQAAFFRIVHASPALQAYLLVTGDRSARLVAAAIAEERGGDPHDPLPLLVATALVAPYPAMLAEICRRVGEGQEPQMVAEQIRAAAAQLYALLGADLSAFG